MAKNVKDLAPDGHGWRARLGVLTHDDNAISESEPWTMASDGHAIGGRNADRPVQPASR